MSFSLVVLYILLHLLRFWFYPCSLFFSSEFFFVLFLLFAPTAFSSFFISFFYKLYFPPFANAAFFVCCCPCPLALKREFLASSLIETGKNTTTVLSEIKTASLYCTATTHRTTYPMDALLQDDWFEFLKLRLFVANVDCAAKMQSLDILHHSRRRSRISHLIVQEIRRLRGEANLIFGKGVRFCAETNQIMFQTPMLPPRCTLLLRLERDGVASIASIH